MPLSARLRPTAAALAAGTAVALAALGAPAASAVPASHSTQPAHRSAAEYTGLLRHRHVDPNIVRAHAGKAANEQSENWSGYIKSGSGFSSSSASWTVPTLATTYNGYSSTWVGIDGATSGDQYLIQTGTEADVVGHKASYDAWWEVITPTDEAPETLYSNLPVKAGDKITASVAKGSGGKWTMTLTDTTTGKSGSHTSSFAGPGQSAEWIQEDTDVNGYISAAPNWHSVTFSGITVNGAGNALSGAAAVDIYDSQGTQEDHTGAPNGSNNGFGVTWIAPGTRTYVG